MTNIDLKTIGKRIKKVREALRLNQEQLGEIVNLSKTSISDYEKGKTPPCFEFLYNLSLLFNVNIEFLFKGDGELFKGEEKYYPATGEKGPFGQYNRDVLEILSCMEKSPLALTAIITLANEYIQDNQALIEKNIKMEKEKKEKNEQKKPGKKQRIKNIDNNGG